MIEDLYLIQKILLAEMPQQGEPLREALDILDAVIEGIEPKD